MQQHRNRASRNNRPSNRGGFNESRRPANLPAVPRSSQVIPGAAVSIVLKADQPTGREVQGVVQDLLSRGDHPRGIKVRLVDGRVGRVQRMASDVASSQISEQMNGNSETRETQDRPAHRGGRRGRGRDRGFGDIRNEEFDPYVYTAERRQQGNHLADYLDAFERRQAAQNPPRPSAEETNTANTSSIIAPAAATCPICGNFEGDEAAVTHHVNSHFT